MFFILLGRFFCINLVDRRLTPWFINIPPSPKANCRLGAKIGNWTYLSVTERPIYSCIHSHHKGSLHKATALSFQWGTKTGTAPQCIKCKQTSQLTIKNLLKCDYLKIWMAFVVNNVLCIFFQIRTPKSFSKLRHRFENKRNI